MFPFNLRGADGRLAEVTGRGELVVGAASPNQSQHWAMTSINTAYNFAPPISGKKMLLQNILMYANKAVANTDAAIVIYTADNATATTGTTVLELELPKYAIRDLIGLHLELEEGLYLNATTDDATVFMTMMGYYIDV